MKDTIYLRKATREDGELLFAWANDMDVRRNSFSQHEISWEEHLGWLNRKLPDESCRIYIACLKTTDVSEKPIGQIRMELTDKGCEIDYSIAEQMRGRGFGTLMVERAMQLADPGCERFVAWVKHSNPASARVFEKCGFEKGEETKEAVCFYKSRHTLTEQKPPTIVICTQKSWNIDNAKRLQQEYAGKYDICVITKKEELLPERLAALAPEYVFFPHWSYLIPEEIYGSFPCVVFHMTDLPFGRGGSPLQNLIVRGYTHTKLSAIAVEQGLDTGAVYGKEELSLAGTAQEILQRASEIIFTRMIPWMLSEHPTPIPQQGEPVVFRRRKPEEGRLLPQMNLKEIYDYIRMLDGEGYPNAFLELGGYRLRFSEAVYQEGSVTAKVIFERGEE